MEVRLEQLAKSFDGVVAVNQLDLHIEAGKLIGLLGPSGCGKTTTLFMLAGLLRPTGGKIYFGPEEVTQLPTEKRGIGLVFQNYALYPHMSVLENIIFPLINLKTPKKEAIRRAEEIAELVQIRELMERKPRQLSGGQQQRVAIARALVKKPPLLLLDEPLSNLDARLRMETREEIRRIQREVGITTLFVTHDQEEAMSISDKIAVMDKGQLQQYDVPQRIYHYPENRFVAAFLGTPSINFLKGTIKDQQLTCAEAVLRTGMSGLEGVFSLGIRPEAFCLDPAGFAVTVDGVEMIGRDLIISFYLAGQKVKALVDSSQVVSPGDSLRLSIKKHQILLFDHQTQQVAIRL